MPVGLEIHIVSTVASPQTWSTLTGQISVPVDRSTIRSTVSRRAVDAFEQPRGTGTFYFRIRLGGEWIPERDLAGPLTIDHHLDAHTSTFEFSLTGRRWSLFATERTWTRTRVEIHRFRGQSASEMLADEPLVGYVKTCDQTHTPEPVVRLRCTQTAGLFERTTVCYELPPFSGKTRGQILGEILTSIGWMDFDVPPGAIYSKGLQVVDQPLFEFLREFLEPEGWKIRWRSSTLEIYEPAPRRAPLPAHARWSADAWQSSRAAPPRTVPGLWVVRGTGAVVLDELGFESTVTVTEIVAPYAPKRAVARQLGGTVEVIEPLHLGSLPEEERVISRVVDQRVTLGERLVEQITEEYGFGNPGAAKLVTSPGSGGGGYLFLDAYIDPDGRYTRWITEKFHLLTRLRTTPFYDSDANLVETRIESSGYHLTTQGVGAHGGTDITVVGSYVHGDDQSYHARYEVWGKFEEQILRYEYDEATGARFRESQDTYRYYAPRCRVTGPENHSWFHLYSGEAQTELRASWRLVETLVKTKILDPEDAAVEGDVETRFGFGGVARKHDGPFDWGGFKSNVERESFGFRDKKTVRYDILNADQVEIETREPERSPRRQTLLGGRPLSAFRESPWTRLRQDPLEMVLEDPTAEAWFGREVRVLSHDHILSTAEGLELLERHRRRALARQVEITRPVTFVAVGDTVEIHDPSSGLSSRGLVVSLRETWDMTEAVYEAVYVLEVEL